MFVLLCCRLCSRYVLRILVLYWGLGGQGCGESVPLAAQLRPVETTKVRPELKVAVQLLLEGVHR